MPMGHAGTESAVGETSAVALVQEAGGHGGGRESERPEVPSGLDLLASLRVAERPFHPFDLKAVNPRTGKTVLVPVKFTMAEAIRAYQNQFFALMLVAVVAAVLARRLKRISFRQPGRFQVLVEMFVEAFRDLVCGVLGEKNGRRYLPYVGSLFLFIFLSNLMGLVPFLRSPTSVYQTTFALGVCTFLYVQFTAVTRNGILRYLYHMAGEPKGESLFMTLFMWAMGICLLLPLHLLGELIKPISLSLRLFGNILGEDVLLGVFVTFGISLMGVLGLKEPWPGLPLQVPFFFLAFLTSTIQALVFALLSMVYLMMVLPHNEHEEAAHQEKAA